jgi:hypothetical protein
MLKSSEAHLQMIQSHTGLQENQQRPLAALFHPPQLNL